MCPVLSQFRDKRVIYNFCSSDCNKGPVNTPPTRSGFSSILTSDQVLLICLVSLSTDLLHVSSGLPLSLLRVYCVLDNIGIWFVNVTSYPSPRSSFNRGSYFLSTGPVLEFSRINIFQTNILFRVETYLALLSFLEDDHRPRNTPLLNLETRYFDFGLFFPP